MLLAQEALVLALLAHKAARDADLLAAHNHLGKQCQEDGAGRVRSGRLLGAQLLAAVAAVAAAALTATYAGGSHGSQRRRKQRQRQLIIVRAPQRNPSAAPRTIW